jgi:hypothetical protein
MHISVSARIPGKSTPMEINKTTVISRREIKDTKTA